MTHPLVENIAKKIANKRKITNNIDLPIEAIIASVITEIDVPVYTVQGTRMNLTLSESLIRSEKNNSDIIHVPSGSSQVKFMLQAYELYACKGYLGNIKSNDNNQPQEQNANNFIINNAQVDQIAWNLPPEPDNPVDEDEEEDNF